MTKIHRPWVTKHGTHCSCSVFCGSDPESWESHAFDVLVLYPEDQVDYRKLSAVEIAFRPIAVAYIEAAKKVAERFKTITENLQKGMVAASDFKRTMDQVTLTPDAAKLDALEAIMEAKGRWEIPDQELPGMWTRSDFMGGDPDERSYAQRCRDGDHVFTNYLKCVYCGRRSSD